MNHTNTMKGNQENMKKKNMSIKLVGGSSGGGALAGIILLGGALALVTTFAFKRKRNSKSEKNKQEDSLNKSKVKEDHALLVGEGLSFLVPDSLSPHLNDHSPSNGTVDTQDEVSRQILLDENSETNVRNNEEMEILEKARDTTFCDEFSIIKGEFSIIKGEFPVPVADSSLPLKLEVDRKNGSLEEVEVMKVDKETMTIDCIQVGDACNDQQLPLRNGNNQEQVEAAHADHLLGLDGKANKQGEECDGNGKTIIQRKGILVEGDHCNQPGTDDDSYKVEDECDADGKIILDRREIPIQAAMVDQTRLDEKPHMREEECYDDAGIVIEKGEELIGEVVVANGIILTEELEATTMYGDQDVLCSDSTLLISNDTETFNSKKPELLLPLIDSSSATKPRDNGHFQDHLVVEDTKILKGDEANEPAMQEDRRKLEDREQTQLNEANGDNKEYYKIYRENTNDKFEEAEKILVKNDHQMQSWEECQKIHITKDPEINLFQGNGFEVQEFPFPPLGSPSLFKSEKLHKYDSAETTLHVEVINPMEKDGLADEVFAYQIMSGNNPSVQLAGNDEMQSYDDGGDSAAAKGEETLKTSLLNIAQQTKLSEEEDDNDDSKEDMEEVETIQRENFKVENNLQLPQKDHHDYNDNVDREEYVNDSDDGDVKDDNDEEDTDNDTEEEYNVEEVEESSEKTGDSSLDCNAEAIWPDESVLEFSQKVKNMQANNQNYKEIKEEDSYSYVKFNSHKLEDDDENSLMMAHSEKLSADTTTLKQPPNILNLKFWFLSLLVPFLLLLWLSLSQLNYFASFHYQLE